MSISMLARNLHLRNSMNANNGIGLSDTVVIAFYRIPGRYKITQRRFTIKASENLQERMAKILSATNCVKVCGAPGWPNVETMNKDLPVEQPTVEAPKPRHAKITYTLERRDTPMRRCVEVADDKIESTIDRLVSAGGFNFDVIYEA